MNIRAKIFGGGIESEPALIKAKAPKGAKADRLHTVAVIRAESRRTNNRDNDRHRLANERVTVVHEGASYHLELVNLSGGGAMVDGPFPAKLWDRVELRVGTDGVIECAVCWMRDGRVGLEFAQETRLDCAVGEQANILRETISRSFPEAEFEGPPAAETAAAAPDSAEQRSDRRHPLIWSGVLHHDFESHSVRLRNISSTGAMIDCPLALGVGAEPLLELGGIELPATVTWAVGDSAGLRFSREFDLGQLAQSRPDVAPPQWQRPTYLNGRKVTKPAPEQQWQHMSLGELRQELEGFLKR
jgi:hypothetical protein